MYKIAILGCENSHADFFLDYIINQKAVDDIEIIGIYSDEKDAALRLQEQFNVYVAENYDEFVGKIDGLIITARHGDNHYKYAKPYISSGIPMFIDKPITISEQEAVEFMEELKANQVRVSGGSMCIHAPLVQELKKIVKTGEKGRVFGGNLRAPFSLDNIYGGFFFYSQHMVQVMMEIFGNDPRSVRMFVNGDVYTCVFRYDKFDVTGVLIDENNNYYAGVNCENEYVAGMYDVYGPDQCPEKEFDAFYRILTGNEQEQSYADFIKPVFVLNAMYRSIQSGKEEEIHCVEGCL